ncbi:DUF5677 domain-containing protein [Paenibacillus beijingensis]|uniref:Uncharacterized protein n=1 Tax=Paenibacillus beijingensis TaxID=1126833 RepID=A0A0D5NLR0_9BACL|nr:DUF5677 domain-containing protein [Paenibacillus beijingensis]AJY76181.1 hypothetical protein VN24_18460 [Paenibacillus beijingensis]
MKKMPSRNSQCPCGSEKKFKKCCINKNFSWILDDDGIYKRSIPIKDPDLIAAIEKHQNRFVEIYGREPKDDDLFFYDQYVSPMDENEVEKMTVKLLEEVNADPAFIHAYKKTGRLVVKGYEGNLTDAELSEWRSALAEYYKLSEELQFEETVSESENNDYLVEFESSLYLFGMIIAKYGHVEGIKLTHNDFIMFCVTKSFKTFKSIQVQLKAGLIEDSLNLLRSVYENYLNIIYVLRYPERLDDLVAARIGMEEGTHEYLTHSSGKSDKRTIVDKVTGQKYIGHISTYSMATASPYKEDILIFDKLYEKLSRFTHPNILVFKHYVSNEKFNPHHRGKTDDVIILSIFT